MVAWNSAVALTRLGLEPTAFMCVAIVPAHLGGPASRMINLGHQKFGGLLLRTCPPLAASSLSPFALTRAWRSANELTPRCYLGPASQCDSSSNRRRRGSHDDASSGDVDDDSTRLA